MKSKMKQLISMVMISAMCFSTVAQAKDISDEDVAKRAASFYEGAGEEFVKISHPEKPASTKTKNVTDGILDYIGNGRMGVPGVDEGANGQGDRGQCYSWAAASYGDWMYISTQFNPMMATVGLMGSGLGHEFDQKTIEATINTLYRGEFFTQEEDGANPGSVLSKINVKTGEMKLLMSRETTNTAVNFRNAIRFRNNLYFCGSVNGIPSIYEIDPEHDDKITCVFQDESMKIEDAWQQALNQQISPAIRGMAVYDDHLVINCVGLDENPYIAISKNPSEGFEKIAFAWEDVENKIPGELLGYPACHLTDSIYGGSIWEIISFNGDLYVALCTGTPANSPDGGKTMQSFAIMRGECSADPMKRESWTWTPVIGDKNDGAKYTFGIDPERNRSGACNMMVYDGHLYIGEYNDTEIALINILFGVDAEFMAENLDQSVNLYRMDKDENIELIVGDKTEMFPEGGRSGLHSGFDKCENQYIWKMDTFEGKLYVGTFDESSILYPVGQFSNGDILHMTQEQWQTQMKYLQELIKQLIDASKKPEEQANQNAKVMSIDGIDTSDVDLEVLEELQEAAEEAPTDLTAADLPGIMSEDGTFQISTIGELHQAMIMMQGMLSQDENWTQEQKLESKVNFANFYQAVYDAYNNPQINKKIPQFIKNIYEKILSNKQLQKIVNMARVIVSLRKSERGFDMMVSTDGIHFDTITRDGLGDGHNQGLRAFAISREEENPWLCIGTANPFYGAQLWRLQADSLSFEVPDQKPDPDENANPEIKPDPDENTNPEMKPEENPADKPSIKPEESKDGKQTIKTEEMKEQNAPKTGDTSHLLLVGGGFVIACAAIAVVLRKRRKDA